MKTRQNKLEIKTKPLFRFRREENGSQLITHPTTATIHTNTTIILPQQGRKN